MQLDNNIRAEKRSARQQALLLAATKSPNLDDMEVFYLDENRKTALYFKKGTSDEFIKERLRKHFRREYGVDNSNYIPQDKVYTRRSRWDQQILTEELGYGN